jgi:phenylpropionate dioxygenase-like ring-hydroxylating dioxygenase large terminal subunit
VGLLDAHCAHRGTSLYYGRIEPEGIRCCYHGWLFDAEGRCLDQPCEPPDSTYKHRVRQPWYPCREYHGLVFAYLGPLDRLPVFPRYGLIEEGEGVVVADGTSYGLAGGVVLDCNWLQIFENVMDPFHVLVLHNTFSGEQFSQALSVRPKVRWEATERGMCSIQDRVLGEGRIYRRLTEVLLPNVRIVPSVAADAEAMVSQRPIALHALEHLASSDQGVIRPRRMLRRAIEAVRRGEDPAGILRDPTRAS